MFFRKEKHVPELIHAAPKPVHLAPDPVRFAPEPFWSRYGFFLKNPYVLLLGFRYGIFCLSSGKCSKVLACYYLFVFFFLFSSNWKTGLLESSDLKIPQIGTRIFHVVGHCRPTD